MLSINDKDTNQNGYGTGNNQNPRRSIRQQAQAVKQQSTPLGTGVQRNAQRLPEGEQGAARKNVFKMDNKIK